MNRPTIPEVMPLVQDYCRQKGRRSGGNLRPVLRDWHVDDNSVNSCVERCRKVDDFDGERLALLIDDYRAAEKVGEGKVSMSDPYGIYVYGLDNSLSAQSSNHCCNQFLGAQNLYGLQNAASVSRQPSVTHFRGSKYDTGENPGKRFGVRCL